MEITRSKRYSNRPERTTLLANIIFLMLSQINMKFKIEIIKIKYEIIATLLSKK
jgi:hypothetical protein